MSNNKPARVRFAPSPTGRLHLGSARTALIDYLMAKQSGGQFILRIEDTDQKRFVEGAEEEIMRGLRWLGLEWDEGPDVGGPYGPYRQSERKSIYQEYAQKLIDMDMAYYCFCIPERLQEMRKEQKKNKSAYLYDGTCRNIDPEDAKRRVEAGEKHVIRFKTPREGITVVNDTSRGEIKIDNRTLDDYVIVKSDGLALYHLAAMIDDHLMGITHVVRGSEWLPTLPLHAMIYRAFGWEEPEWVHLSVFLKPTGKGKMSKREAAELRNDGYSIFIDDLESLGYISEGVINWIALMGWSLDDHTEFFTLPDLVRDFSIERLNPSPAAINFSKFDHFNGLHIRNLSQDELAKRLKPFYEAKGYKVDDRTLMQVIPLVQERLATLDDAPRVSGFFFKDEVIPEAEDLIAKKLTAEESLKIAERIFAILSGLESLDHENAEPPLRDLVEEMGFKAGQIFGVARVAVTGQKVSPPLFEGMEIIGKEKVLQRMSKAIELLKGLCE